MTSVVVSLLHSLRFALRSRALLHLEILALRHQLTVVHRSRHPRLRLTSADRMLWAWLARAWGPWQSALYIVKPETLLAWHRRGFRLFWTWKSRQRTGRPGVPAHVRALIRTLSTANPLWGAPRIHGELQKLGISVSQSTVAKFIRRDPRPPSQTWRTFLTAGAGLREMVPGSSFQLFDSHNTSGNRSGLCVIDLRTLRRGSPTRKLNRSLEAKG